MIDWRTWTYDSLRADVALTAVLDADSVYGAGGIEQRPEVLPFLVIRFLDDTPAVIPGVVESFCQLWVHDAPGDYLLITQCLGLAKAALLSLVSPGMPITWVGDSQELIDESYNTFCRFGSFIMRSSE